VERILGMVDGCLLLVDAEEGVMPQTKFVLGKALKLGLRPIVVLNKVDRPHADPDKVLNEAFDLFAAMGADDDQLDFPHLYASGKQGWAVVDMKDPQESLAPIFDKIVEHVPAPAAEQHQEEPAQILAVLIETITSALYDKRRKTVERSTIRRESAEMHREIYRAIKARKPQEAHRLMDEHLRIARAAQGMEHPTERKMAASVQRSRQARLTPAMS